MATVSRMAENKIHKGSKTSSSPSSSSSSTTSSVTGKKNTPNASKSVTNASTNSFRPMSLEEIQPELIAYGPSGEMITIQHDISAKKAFQLLKD
ncbi:hypothetical protein BLA29_014873, partial [Euroglyphus maynei]